MELKELRRQLREIKAEMKATGVRRTSCFNGGHSPVSYRLNAECFRLECLIKEAKRLSSSRADSPA